MRLVLALAALLLGAPTARAADPVAWEDPCRDAAPALRVAGTPIPLPSVAGSEVDLHSVEVDATSPDAVVVHFAMCTPLGTGEGTFVDVEADLADGCLLTARWQDRVNIAPNEVRRVAVVSRTCDRDGVVRAHDELAEVPFAVAGDRLTSTIPRSSLSTGLASGTVLRGLAATATETAALPARGSSWAARRSSGAGRAPTTRRPARPSSSSADAGPHEPRREGRRRTT